MTTTEVAKPESKPDAKPDAKPEATVRVLRTDTCPSLSGKSTLTYELGCDDRAQLQLRIAQNTGKGMFSAAWVPWEGISELLDAAGDKPVTSHTLHPLYRGTSANSPGFLLAALRHEGLVQPLDDKARGYRRRDPKAFLVEARALMGTGSAGSTRKGPKRASNGRVSTPTEKQGSGAKANLVEDVVALLASGTPESSQPGTGAATKTALSMPKASVSAKKAQQKPARAVKALPKAVKPLPVKKKASAGRR
jgi:hypothetical protein